MKILNPTIEIIPQSEGIEGIYKQVELAGRTCYQSFENITKDSARKFTDRMMKSGHCGMLEHATIYLKAEEIEKLDNNGHAFFINPLERYNYNKYSEVSIYDFTLYVTTNLRVLFENNWMDDLKYLCEPTKYHEKRITIRMTTDIGVTREGNRHK